MSEITKPSEVFAFVAPRPCGCVCQAATPRGLVDMIKNKHFREQMDAGKIRTVMTREEWMSLPWKCEKCEPKKQSCRRLLDE